MGNFFKKFTFLCKEIWREYGKKMIIPLLEIVGMIILCAILAYVLNGHETLAEYAARK
ncbi:MAG: hypothetical protein K6E19_09260 [Lachnospiraceae bacterium]|nr:hypothetical protein [Lachnospiraceae bacterium]